MTLPDSGAPGTGDGPAGAPAGPSAAWPPRGGVDSAPALIPRPRGGGPPKEPPEPAPAAPAQDQGEDQEQDQGEEPPPAYPRGARPLLLAAVLVCAACGLVYELALSALGGELGGDPVTETSIVLSVMVFAMGAGALAAKPLARHPAVAFVTVEALLAVGGGTCVFGVYASFAWLGGHRVPMILVSCLLGLLIGAEIPLLMTLVQRIRRQDAGTAVADLFAADYVGALLGGLLFPYLLLPHLGQTRTVVAAGVVNALAGAVVVLRVFRADLGRRARTAAHLMTGAALVLLAGAWVYAPAFETAARNAMVEGRVVEARNEVVVTRRAGGTEMYIAGERRVPVVGGPEAAAALTRPAMAGPHGRVLLLGGSDGLALREVLRHPGVREVVAVVPDRDGPLVARTDPGLRALNAGAFDDPRVRLEVADPFAWVRAANRPFDVVLADLPGPRTGPGARLYSREFYGLVRRVLAPEGRVAVRAVPPTAARKAYWCVDSGLRAAGLRTLPYRFVLPGPLPGQHGEHGFLLAAADRAPAPRIAGGPEAPGAPQAFHDRFAAATVFPPEAARVEVPPSTLTHPRLTEYTGG